MRTEQQNSAGDSSTQASTGTGLLDASRHGEATREFECFLRARIVGQDAAIDAVTEMYQMFLVGLNPPDRPVGNLLFLGPRWFREDLRRGSSRGSVVRQLNIPFGTALGAFGLWVMLQRGTQPLFRRA